MVARLPRRQLVRLFGAAPLASLLAACGGGSAVATPPAVASPTRPPEATAAPPTQAAQPSPTAAALAVATAANAPATATSAPGASAAPASATTAPAAAATTAPPPAAKPAAGAAQALAPTPACADSDDVTPAQTEGPYYTPNTPQRASLIEPGMGGTKLVMSGRVLSTGCQPVGRALIDFWQADDKGQYDNVGFKLRGHQFTDAQGIWRLETIVPALYPGRTRHIHVKVQAPTRPVLTTQLYFPDEPGNARDGIFNRDLVMAVRDASGAKEATFDFVLKA